jgi:DNA-binding transcriptional LysR family regulator
MDTNLILQFRTVFEAGTIIRASEQLNMTAGALSRAMKRLELELGCNLFTPSGRNILPTEEAQLFYHSSQSVLESLDHAKRSIKKIQSRTRELKIATFEVFSTHFMAWFIQNQKIDFPVTLFECTPGQIEKNILTGIADYGLTYTPELNTDLDHLMIGEMPIGVFVSAKAKDKSKNKDLPYAVPITELGVNHIQAKSLDGWPTDLPRNIRFKFELLETALDLTSRGFSKILCPKFIVQIENGRLNKEHQLLEIEQNIRLTKFKVYAIKKKTQIEDEYFKRMCKGVRLALKR